MREAIVRGVSQTRSRVAAESDNPESIAVEGVFAWHSERDGPHLLRVPWGGPAEFHPQFTAIGSPRTIALFALNRLSHMGYGTIPLEAAKMLALNVADEVIASESAGVALPVQMAIVT